MLVKIVGLRFGQRVDAKLQMFQNMRIGIKCKAWKCSWAMLCNGLIFLMSGISRDAMESCKAVGVDCQGADGNIVEDKGPEVVDMGFVEQQKGADAGGAVAVYQDPGSAEDDASKKRDPNRARRPAFDVVLERSGKHWRTLGLLVSPDDDPRYLIIDDIWEPSLISEWNASHGEDQKVRAGDLIVSVNNSTCNGEEMLSKIQALGKGASIQLRVE